jgi:ABC-type antimicrobial peptide transport system permease subunit
MVLAESVSVCLAGGLLGVGLGYLLVDALSKSTVLLGTGTANITASSLQQVFIVVLVMGLVAGLYPAWRASRLQPVEALRYEGGTGSKARRLPLGGMAVQSLWQRSTRTLLTVCVIGITVGAIMALEGAVNGMMTDMTDMFASGGNQIMIRQADISDTSLSAIDERVGDKIAAMPEIESVSGLMISAIVLPDSSGFMLLLGYGPNELAIRRLRIVEGESLRTNHQIILGRSMADALKKEVGDTIDLSGIRFRVVGIYESAVSWEELGGAITLRDAQVFIGRPRKVTMFAVKVRDPSRAAEMVDKINAAFPEVHAALSGDFADEMPDFEASNDMLEGISAMAIFVGGIGVLNAMLMAVFERTREIGVLRALGWRRRMVLGMILREALLMGLIGGLAGILIAFGLVELMEVVPMVGEYLTVIWSWEIFARAIGIALLLGLVGGLYPAFRATRLQPVEALRYE